MFSLLDWVGLTAIAALLGAGSATGTLALARRADERAVTAGDEKALLE
jgi:hypothetical protein